MAMFTTQVVGPDNKQQQSAGLFSAGNAFGQAAGQSYNNTAQWLQNNPANYDNAPKLPGVDDFSADRQRIEQALIGRAKGELDTRYGQESADFEQRMANEGVDIGSERYKREKALFEKGRNEAYNDANFRAMLAGGDEQSRLFGMGMSARQQAVSETDNLRNSRLAEMAAILNPALEMEGLITNRNIADMQNETQRYGIDKNFETSGLDRASREALARMQDETQRYGVDKSFLTGQLDRDQRKLLQDDQQTFEKGENKENRKVQREGIKRSGGGGGGGGGLNLDQLLQIVERLTGEKLSG
jgi:hypothetical protein